jgi:hypothetical protein
LLHTTLGKVEGILTCENPNSFILTVPADKGGLTSTWLAGISSAFVWYDPDMCHRIPDR